MPKRFGIVVGLVLAITGGTCVHSFGDDNGPATRPGASTQDADVDAIKSLLTQLTNAAIAKNGFNRLTQYLQIQTGATEAATNPATGGYFRNFDDINDAIDLLRRDWKYKYDGDFIINADNQAVIYNEDFRISLEKAGEGAQTAGEHVNADGSGNPPRPQGSGSIAIESSRETLGVSLRLAATAPGAWKVVLGSNANEQTIHDALLKQLNILHDQRSNWPADKTSASRLVSNYIMRALVEAEAGNQK